MGEVNRMRRRVFREEFERYAKQLAHAISREREQQDWHLALREFARSGADPILSSDPRWQKVQVRAHEIYEARRTGHDLDDNYFEAQRRLIQEFGYEVID